MPGIAVVGIHGMAGGAARAAVVARVVVGAQHPQVRVVEAGLGEVDHRHRHPVASARATVRLPQVRPARLVEALQEAQHVGQADLGEGGVDDPAAALEDPEHVGRRHGLPGRQWVQGRQHAARGERRIAGIHRVLQHGRLALAGVGLAEGVDLVGQDAVVVRRAAPEHGRGRHQAALLGLDDGQMAGAAGFTGHPKITRVHEAHIGRVLLGPARHGMGGIARPMAEGADVGGQHVGRLLQCRVGRAARRLAAAAHGRIAAMAVGAAQHHPGIGVHGGLVGLLVAGDAAGGLGLGQAPGLARRGRRELPVLALDLDDAGRLHRERGRSQGQHGGAGQQEEAGGRTGGHGVSRSALR
jgi:hypothetical protein